MIEIEWELWSMCDVRIVNKKSREGERAKM